MRNGTTNLFVAVEPKAGRRVVSVTAHRGKTDFVAFIDELLTGTYARARRIHLVLDNLNTHFRKCFDDVLGRRAANKLLRRAEFHCTPKHASWLNMAEIEIGILNRQWLDRRIASRNALQTEVDAWQQARNAEQRLTATMKILSEIGPDLRRFANVKHFCSWLGLCPGTKISGGKVLSAKTKRSANRLRQALKMAAMSLSHSGSALGAFYRRLCSRMDKPRANTATAHKLARMVYFMLTRGEDFVDKGQQHYEEQQRQRSIAALRRRAATLGYAVMPIAAPA